MKEKINKAIKIIIEYGVYDGGHHKQWVLDQVMRALLGSDEEYEAWVDEYRLGDDGPYTYHWDEGIAP